LINYPAGKSNASYSIPESVTSIQDAAFSSATVLTNITIPATVTNIGASAFSNATALTNITIPEGVTNIGESAFSGATALPNIVIPSSVTNIGNSAFYHATSLAAVTFQTPSQLTNIGYATFWGATSLTNITIPATVTDIGYGAFADATALTNITIPASVTNIENRAFYGATSLASFTVDNANVNYSSTDGVLFNKDTTTLINYPARKNATFYSIPLGVTSIKSGAFYGAITLAHITIPATVTSINDTAFSGATSLTTVEVDSANVNYSSTDGVLFNKDTTTLISYPAGKSNASYLIPHGVTRIFYRAFYGATTPTRITIPASVTRIDDEVFSGATALINLVFLGNAPPTIGYRVFFNVAERAKANITPIATGFANVGHTWNGLIVEIGLNTPGAQNPDPVVDTPGPKKPPPSGETPAPVTETPAASTPAPVANTPASAVNTSAARAAAAVLAAKILGFKKSFVIKTLAKRVGIKIVSSKATVSLLVSKLSKKICFVSKSKLSTLKAGKCNVTFTVQEPTPKKGKKPKTKKTVMTLVVK